MKHIHRILWYSIGIIILFSIIVLWYMYYTTYHKRKEHNTNHINILTTLKSGQSFLIQWTYNHNENIFSWSIKWVLHNIQRLFTSKFTLQYNPISHHINSLSIEAISEYQDLNHAEIVFIEDLIIPSIGTNLIQKPLQHIDFQNSQNFLTNTMLWSGTYTTHNNSKQLFNIHIQQYCSLRYYLWWWDTCSIHGTIDLTTPLVSGPISWKIQGSFWTSTLQ